MEIHYRNLSIDQRAELFDEIKQSNTLTLGELISQLKQFPKDYAISFDFSALPRDLDSWRGDYSQLALQYDDEWRTDATVGGLLEHLKDSIGKTVTGYKGGDYAVDTDKNVWVANNGNVGHLGIVCLTREYDNSESVIIHTAYISY